MSCVRYPLISVSLYLYEFSILSSPEPLYRRQLSARYISYYCTYVVIELCCSTYDDFV